MAEVFIKAGRQKSILRKHPWIFSGSVHHVEGSVEVGETVIIRDSHGQFLAYGAYSPASQIRVRIWSWDESDKIEDEFIYTRIWDCWKNREHIRNLFHHCEDSAYRLVNGESDRLPGLIVDCYSGILVVQLLSAGAEYWKDSIIDSLMKITGHTTVIERSDADVRQLENFPERKAIIRGDLSKELVLIQENAIRFWVDLLKGHKTGFYLDQKENRRIIQTISEAKSILDCFCYTGGFTCSAAKGGASSIVAIDSSLDSLTLAQKNISENGFNDPNIEFIHADVFTQLRRFRDSAKSFDLIILDPPKFAQSVSQVERAARGYKDINLLAMKLLKPGGLLTTFSCSGGVSEDLFQKIIAGAALDAGVHTRILKRLHQNYDHPVSGNFPEGAYLKGFLLAVD